MNGIIEKIFKDFEVDGVSIPVAFLYYEGHDEPYITYMQMDAGNSYSADNKLLGYVNYYDFNIYSKGNFTAIIRAVKEKLQEAGFEWQPSRSSADMYETDTGYYHKTLNFAVFVNEN